MDTVRTIREVGYEGKTIDEVVRSLQTWEVATLVDVRLNAVSRKKGFSKKALKAAVEDAGLRYVHLPALGNPKDNRTGFYAPGTAAAQAAHERFLESLKTDEAEASLRQVENLSDNGGVALLCFEADRSMCHRDLIATLIFERSLQPA